jgi:hypothetical protein
MAHQLPAASGAPAAGISAPEEEEWDRAYRGSERQQQEFLEEGLSRVAPQRSTAEAKADADADAASVRKWGGYVNVSNIAPSAAMSDVFAFFSSGGAPPVETWLAVEGDLDGSEGAEKEGTFAVVNFATGEHLAQALALSGALLLGREIRTMARHAVERRMPVPDEMGMLASVYFEGRVFRYAAHGAAGAARLVHSRYDWKRENGREGHDVYGGSAAQARGERACSLECPMRESARQIGVRARADALRVRDDVSGRAGLSVPGGLWVRGLPAEITAKMLRCCFERFARVDKVRMVPTQREDAHGSAQVILGEPVTPANMMRGEYGALTIPGSRHVIRPRDMRALEPARDPR